LELPGSLIDGAVLELMHKQLAGMDSRKIVSAMGSTRERIFRVWHAEESKSPWDDRLLRSRFGALVGRLGGIAERADDAFARLCTAWSGNDRCYHDMEHLIDCLREIDRAGSVREQRLTVHDIGRPAIDQLQRFRLLQPEVWV
jgi:hypothetical protein